MGWPEALAALTALVSAADGIDAVEAGTVASAAELGASSTVAVLPPAGRRTVRLAGEREVTWTQEVVVLRHAGGIDSASMRAAMDAVSAATVAVDDALEASITLGGAATLVRPLAWQPGEAFEIPAGSGQLFAGQSGTCEVVLVASARRGA